MLGIIYKIVLLDWRESGFVSIRGIFIFNSFDAFTNEPRCSQ